MGQGRGGAGGCSGEIFGRLLDELERSVAAACRSRERWPDQVAAGIYAGVDFAIEQPAVIDAVLALESTRNPAQSGYTEVIERLARLISRDAPSGSRLPGSTDEALVAGIVGMVGDHVRTGRTEALAALRPDLVLLALLPYLGFDEARRCANELSQED